ncbi:uncharacterized protein at4g28440 [Phtheirospermum japonicum]|uniref:Uncharacterized protein at4g28440 n=1 Tax=Phtheirospermum japonicum TaxID=374723 RepID=A0A830C4X0_9LAMI|nr:uncharacterized protein at4g28440 [Phtheirospermum japonicum]
MHQKISNGHHQPHPINGHGTSAEKEMNGDDDVGKNSNSQSMALIHGLRLPDPLSARSIHRRFDMMKPVNTVIIRNAMIDMFKGTMRLAVDKWGCIEVTELATFLVKEDNKLSLVEYKSVTVAL